MCVTFGMMHGPAQYRSLAYVTTDLHCKNTAWNEIRAEALCKNGEQHVVYVRPKLSLSLLLFLCRSV